MWLAFEILQTDTRAQRAIHRTPSFLVKLTQKPGQLQTGSYLQIERLNCWPHIGVVTPKLIWTPFDALLISRTLKITRHHIAQRRAFRNVEIHHKRLIFNVGANLTANITGRIGGKQNVCRISILEGNSADCQPKADKGEIRDATDDVSTSPTLVRPLQLKLLAP